MSNSKISILASTEISSNFDTDAGFAWVEFVFDGEKYTLQACLKLAEHNHSPLYLSQVEDSVVESGFHDGVCGDVNEPAIQKFGEEESFELFKRNLNGVQFI